MMEKIIEPGPCPGIDQVPDHRQIRQQQAGRENPPTIIKPGKKYNRQYKLANFFEFKYIVHFHQDPAYGVPNIPTASSAHTIKNKNNIAPQIIIRFRVLFTFLKVNSHKSPAPNNKTPITAKSKIFQSTCAVNCMAIKGMDNRSAAIAKIASNLLLFIASNFL